jgi:hypothetical protein
VHWHHDDGGAFDLRGRLPAEDGAVLVKTLELAMVVMAESSSPTGRSPGQAAAVTWSWCTSTPTCWLRATTGAASSTPALLWPPRWPAG